jgi:hypothetical protein
MPMAFPYGIKLTNYMTDKKVIDLMRQRIRSEHYDELLKRKRFYKLIWIDNENVEHFSDQTFSNISEAVEYQRCFPFATLVIEIKIKQI